MAGILRGEIYWADLEPIRGNEQAGHRPVLVLTGEAFNSRSRTVIAMAITSRPQRAGFPFTLALPEGVLPKPSWVKVSQVRVLAIERLGQRLGQLPPEEMGRVVEGLLEIVGQ